MKREDFWYPPEAESAGAIPAGTKAGQFLFLSGQTSVDIDTGKMIRDFIDLPKDTRDKLTTKAHIVNAYFGPVMAQTETIYRNISKLLAVHGASLKDVIQQRIFLPDPRDTGWMERVMLSFFPEDKPTTLVLGVPNRGVHEDIRVWVDMIALVPQTGGLKKEPISLPELQKVTCPYPQAVKVGQFLFFEGLMGIDPRTGRPATTFEQLGPEAKNLHREGQFSDGTSEAMKTQYWLTFFGHLRKVLESQGASLDDILILEGFTRNGMRDLCQREYLREKTWASAEKAPLSFHFGDSSLSIIPEIEIAWGGVALLPGPHKKIAGNYFGKGGTNNNDAVGFYSCVTKAGPFAFGGGVGYNVPKQGSYTSFHDLADDVASHGRFLVQGRIDDNHPIMSKAWHIYQRSFDKAGIQPHQVLHQTVYLKNPSAWPAVESIARIVFNGHLPPTTIIPVDEIAFYWKYHTSVPESVGGEMLEIMFRYLDT